MVSFKLWCSRGGAVAVPAYRAPRPMPILDSVGSDYLLFPKGLRRPVLPLRGALLLWRPAGHALRATMWKHGICGALAGATGVDTDIDPDIGL